MVLQGRAELPRRVEAHAEKTALGGHCSRMSKARSQLVMGRAEMNWGRQKEGQAEHILRGRERGAGCGASTKETERKNDKHENHKKERGERDKVERRPPSSSLSGSANGSQQEEGKTEKMHKGARNTLRVSRGEAKPRETKTRQRRGNEEK